VQQLSEGKTIEEALIISNAPKAASSFVLNTFDIINKNKPYITAAVFTFGREDLIPDMFIQLIDKMDSGLSANFSTLRYYINRHIEVDGGHHSHLALQRSCRKET
jgi:hypothetical protein